MNKKEFIKYCQLLTNKDEFEKLKGTIKSLEYHLQDNFISGLKLGVKHSLLEKFATDTFEIEKKTKLGFGDFYREYFLCDALTDESRMDLVKYKILYDNAKEFEIDSGWERKLTYQAKAASSAGEKLSGIFCKNNPLEYSAEKILMQASLSESDIKNLDRSMAHRSIIEKNINKQRDMLLDTLTITLRKHLGREPDVPDFKKCKLLYSMTNPDEEEEFTYNGQPIVRFEHKKGIYNNDQEISYKHEIKIILL